MFKPSLAPIVLQTLAVRSHSSPAALLASSTFSLATVPFRRIVREERDLVREERDLITDLVLERVDSFQARCCFFILK